MRRRVLGAWIVLFTAAAFTFADEPKRPAVIELLLPAGATAKADGTPLDEKRTVTIDDLKPGEIRRVKLTANFADGTSDERLVDVAAGQRVPVPFPPPGPERPSTVATQPLTPITSAALSRDGRHIVVGLEDHAAVLWDTTAGRPVRTFAGHQKAVLSVAFSPDGRRLLTGSADGTAQLWDVATGDKVTTFRGHTGSVLSAAFLQDGKRILTGSADGTAIVWDARTGKPALTLKGHTKEVMAVAVSPDGATLATASADSRALLWEAETGKQTLVLKGHSEGVSCLTFSADGRRIGTGSWENVGIVWDAATGKKLMATARHGNDVYSVAFTPDGRHVLTGDREESIHVSDTTTGERVRTFVGHSADVVALVTRPDGRVLLTGSRDGTAKLYDLATGRELLTLTTDSARKTWAVVAPDGLFDASHAGRHVIGYRFAKLPTSEADQFFRDCYRPGLLAEIWNDRRPYVERPIGRGRPPLVKIVAPKSRVSPDKKVSLAVDVTDQGGGVSGLTVEIDGARVAVPFKSEPLADGKTTRTTFSLAIAPGANKVRLKAANADGSWESSPAEVELTRPRPPELGSRMYVVAVGVGRPVADAKAVADFLRERGKPFDRVDVVPLYDRDATRVIVEDTIRDVAELTRPQDALVVLVFGHGATTDGDLSFTPYDAQNRGLLINDVVAALGTAPALKRALIVDTAMTAAPAPSPFALRGIVERLAREQGVHVLAAVGRDGERGTLGPRLLAVQPRPEPITVADWFQSASLNSADVQSSTQAKGFPILMLSK